MASIICSMEKITEHRKPMSDEIAKKAANLSRANLGTITKRMSFIACCIFSVSTSPSCPNEIKVMRQSVITLSSFIASLLRFMSVTESLSSEYLFSARASARYFAPPVVAVRQ